MPKDKRRFSSRNYGSGKPGFCPGKPEYAYIHKKINDYSLRSKERFAKFKNKDQQFQILEVTSNKIINHRSLTKRSVLMNTFKNQLKE
jgi:hypothetical protein